MIKRDPLPKPIALIPWMRELHQYMERQGYVSVLESATAFDDHPTVIALSDYGGDANHCSYLTYAFLYAGYKALRQWHEQILRLKIARCGDERTIRYKDLRDTKRQTMLPEWLSLANSLPGYLIVGAVDKRIPNLFIDATGQELAETFASLGLSGYTSAVAEKTLRVLHMLCYFAALMLRPEKKFLWKTDEDDIAGSGGYSPRLRYLGELYRGVMNMYIAHPLVEFGYAVDLTGDELRFFEDGLSLPDLAAGACADYFSQARQLHLYRREEIVLWLANEETLLQKIIFRFDCVGRGPSFKIKEVRFRKHGLRVKADKM